MDVTLEECGGMKDMVEVSWWFVINCPLEYSSVVGIRMWSRSVYMDVRVSVCDKPSCLRTRGVFCIGNENVLLTSGWVCGGLGSRR